MSTNLRFIRVAQQRVMRQFETLDDADGDPNLISAADLRRPMIERRRGLEGAETAALVATFEEAVGRSGQPRVTMAELRSVVDETGMLYERLADAAGDVPDRAQASKSTNAAAAVIRGYGDELQVRGLDAPPETIDWE